MAPARIALVGVLVCVSCMLAAGADTIPTTRPSTAPATAPATLPAVVLHEDSPAGRLLQRMEQLGRAFDPALADLYNDDAVIRNTRRYPDGTTRVQTFPAPKYKQLMRNLMGVAKARGDVSTYSDVTFTPEGDRVRISAKRFSRLKNYTSPVSWLVGPNDRGEWVVFEETSESRP